MSHPIHTCTLPEDQQPTVCRACREDELKEVGSWMSEALRGQAQGHIVPHAHQVPFDAEPWLTQAPDYPESTNWWEADREDFLARRHLAARNLHPVQNNNHRRPAPQAAQQVNMQVPAGQAANQAPPRHNQAPPQLNGTRANDAGHGARYQPQAWTQHANTADARPRVFGAVTRSRRPATVDASNVGRAQSVAHQQGPRTSKTN
ncbi:hypothetical protein LTR91_023306 [Friedmanniomyces endolithicus]|uniref:Uncharacterized protein n=1 Tax=Friedmanniomyces endolithicus TaxID=329885 RepID=A0AAN6H4F4_9PEZI|nr:hypothetical protein LTR94_016447 [Friedmanniomyces endolithicus]KAK0776062.1 hypothetical protein LTR59_014329 [Friedmanniomyces endolithicus]KAK0781314.1 hypothetical protein LTR38_013795 [Friedmanniomyces endolithicus]KAK0805746.1 hypothetical protein LTR75_007208 [Friedmanniomyces endolithicus]KAK0836281.1 hypothetical protein LTR03_013805 [Friedmanniomyces endolithicus]